MSPREMLKGVEILGYVQFGSRRMAAMISAMLLLSLGARISQCQVGPVSKTHKQLCKWGFNMGVVWSRQLRPRRTMTG